MAGLGDAGGPGGGVGGGFRVGWHGRDCAGGVKVGGVEFPVLWDLPVVA